MYHCRWQLPRSLPVCPRFSLPYTLHFIKVQKNCSLMPLSHFEKHRVSWLYACVIRCICDKIECNACTLPKAQAASKTMNQTLVNFVKMASIQSYASLLSMALNTFLSSAILQLTCLTDFTYHINWLNLQSLLNCD